MNSHTPIGLGMTTDRATEWANDDPADDPCKQAGEKRCSRCQRDPETKREGDQEDDDLKDPQD